MARFNWSIGELRYWRCPCWCLESVWREPDCRIRIELINEDWRKGNEPERDYKQFAAPGRVQRRGGGGNIRRVAPTVGRRVQHLREDQELPLAHERPPFSRLPPAAG